MKMHETARSRAISIALSVVIVMSAWLASERCDSILSVDVTDVSALRVLESSHRIASWEHGNYRVNAIRDARVAVTGELVLFDKMGKATAIRLRGVETHIVTGRVAKVTRLRLVDSCIVACAESDEPLAARIEEMVETLGREYDISSTSAHWPALIIASREASEIMRLWDRPMLRSCNLISEWSAFGLNETPFCVARVVASGMVRTVSAGEPWVLDVAACELAQHCIMATVPLARYADAGMFTGAAAGLAMQAQLEDAVAMWRERAYGRIAAQQSLPFDAAALDNKIRTLLARIKAVQDHAMFRRVASGAGNLSEWIEGRIGCLSQEQWAGPAEVVARARGVLVGPRSIAKDDRVARDALEECGGAMRVRVASTYSSFLEDCGCKGKKLGGFTRLLDAQEKATEPLVFLGNMIARPGSQRFSSAGAQYIVDKIRETGAVYVPGVNDLLAMAYGGTRWKSEQPHGARLVLANVTARAPDALPLSASATLSGDAGANGVVIGVLDLAQCRHNADIYMLTQRYACSPPEEAIERLLRDIPVGTAIWICGNWIPRAAGVFGEHKNVVVLVDDFRKLRVVPNRVPHEDGVAADQNAWRVNGVSIVACDAFQYGYNLLTLGRRESMLAKWQTVYLSGAVESQRIAVETRRVLESLSELSDVPSVVCDEDMAELRRGNAYVGAESCSSCHAAQYRRWRGTKHADSMLTLEIAQRHRAPGCVVCHVTGGYSANGHARDEVPSLNCVGCEACHGPGQAHTQRPGERAMRKPTTEASCMACHDVEHSHLSTSSGAYLRTMAALCRGR